LIQFNKIRIFYKNPGRKFMYDIFISYSANEKKMAEDICAKLETDGIPSWMAPRNIVAGSNWPASVAQAVMNAKLVVLLLSESANQSEFVAREVALAASNHQVIIPFMTDDVIPSDLMKFYLAVSQWLDARGKPLEEAMHELVLAAKAYLVKNKWNEQDNPAVSAAQSAAQMLDIYNKQMDWVGTALRKSVHREGFWHKTFHCWFISQEDNRIFLWFQKRSMKKSDFPGLLDITAARHLLAGETDREGINKINLELGLDVNFEDVHYLGIRTYAEKIDKFSNREFNSVYLYPSIYSLSDFNLQTDEVSGIVKLNIHEGLRLFIGEVEEITAIGCDIDNGKAQIKNQRISVSDFVPRKNDYYVKMLHAAQDYFNEMD
jgi:isopentenyldiphosphate isomerase